MNHMFAPTAAETNVALRSINLELNEDLRRTVTEKAVRLFAHSDRIRHIDLTVERVPTQDPAAAVIAKGEVTFDGPALLTSVTAHDASQALDYLLEKLEHHLRRQRAPRNRIAPARP